jgi:hypothetical protein
MNSIEFPYTQSFSGACPRCRFVIPALSEVSDAYFEEGFVKCSKCGLAIDLWEATFERVIRLAGFTASLAALGPRITNLKIRLLATETVELDFTRYGISEGATILLVNYTPQGGNCLPLETHANTPPRRFRGTKIYLYGWQMKTSEGVPIEEEFSGDNISVMVLWAPVEGSDAPWLYLVDAIEAVTLGRFSQAIVPAHAAAEICMRPIVHSFLIKYSARKDVDRFLKQERRRMLSFSSILNDVVPLVCGLVGAKRLPDVIKDSLNDLRDLRNEFMHEGVLPTAVDAKRVRRLLCAAAFGFEYGKYLRQFLK